uniref:CCHC-type domain-containing protein n=1 Tax=Photinus pyralis TaxID=7054 RepID=A0A1Y1KZF6_PHOPY
MAPPYEINRLSSDELIYELTVKGITEVATVEEMRKSLRRLLKLEKEGQSFTYPEYPFSVEDDLRALSDKITELENLLQDFDGSDENLGKKISTKINFAINRADKIIPQSTEGKNKKSRIMIAILNVKSGYEKKTRVFMRTSMTQTQGVLDLNLLGDNESDSDSSIVEVNACSTPKTNRADIRTNSKSIPVLKWNLKFTGKPTDMSLSAFLERVKELKISRHISDKELFDSANDLFSEIALIWFRANKSKVSDWEGLTRLLREEFQPRNYNDMLFKQIKERTQHPDESMGIYTAYMDNHFQRLTVKIPESARLKILLDNMAPFYKIGLALQIKNIKSVSELLELARELEANRISVNDYVPPPPKSKNILERDLACIYSDPPPVDEVGAMASNVKCFRCNQLGHIAINCRNRQGKFCYKCKKPNFTVRTCPNCNQHSKN